MAEQRASAKESGVQRSPRLVPRLSSLLVELSALVGAGAQRQSEDQQSVMLDISGNNYPILSSIRHSTSSNVRSAIGGVGPQTVEEILVRRRERRAVTDGLFALWRSGSVEMRQRSELLADTPFFAFLEIKGNKIVETWASLDPLRTDRHEWITFCIDGATIRIDKSAIVQWRDLYIAHKDTTPEKFLFLTETLQHLKQYVSVRTLGDLVKDWGRVVNPLTDVIVADFTCASCNKTRRLQYLHARLVLQNIAPAQRRCHALGVKCSIPASETLYHPVPKTLEKLILEDNQRETLINDNEEEY